MTWKELKKEIPVILVSLVVGGFFVFYWVMIPAMADDLYRNDLGYESKSLTESLMYTFLSEKVQKRRAVPQ